MDENKRTGLAGSFLFGGRRPVPAPTEEPASMPPAPAPRPEVVVPTARRAAPSRSRLRDFRDRCTIYLTPEVNQALDLVARIEKKKRSEVASEILSKHLPRYRIDQE